MEKFYSRADPEAVTNTIGLNGVQRERQSKEGEGERSGKRDTRMYMKRGGEELEELGEGDEDDQNSPI